MAEVIPFPCGNSEQRKILQEQNTRRQVYLAGLKTGKPMATLANIVDRWHRTPRKDK